MFSSKAPSTSAGAMATDFSRPETSVNHRRMKLMSRSSIARRTYSCCLSMVPPDGVYDDVAHPFMKPY